MSTDELWQLDWNGLVELWLDDPGQRDGVEYVLRNRLELLDRDLVDGAIGWLDSLPDEAASLRDRLHAKLREVHGGTQEDAGAPPSAEPEVQPKLSPGELGRLRFEQLLERERARGRPERELEAARERYMATGERAMARLSRPARLLRIVAEREGVPRRELDALAAEALGVSESTVRREVARLVEAGDLEWVKRPGAGRAATLGVTERGTRTMAARAIFGSPRGRRLNGSS